MKKIVAIAAVAVALAATPALASTDGVLSQTTSVGKVDVTTVIPPLVRVSGLSDLTINVTATDLLNPYFSRQDAETKFCVYSNVGMTGTYSITVDGTASVAGGGHGPFTLTGTSNNLDYGVWLSDNANNAFTSGSYTFPGSTKTGYKASTTTGTRPATTDCTDTGKNAVLHIGVDNAAILAATAGTYKGTLTVTVSPL